MEQKESLLSKLAKLKKAGLIAVAAASVGLMTSCGPTNETKPQTTDPQTTDVEHGGSGTTADDGKTVDDSGNKPEKKYTALLSYIRDNKKYQRYIAALKDGRLKNDSAAFDSHPYTFFKSKGADVELIASNLLPAYTKTYTVASEPNNLYMLTYFADDTNTYYNEYALRYTLTNDEMAEYKEVHQNRNFEAVFMNDAVASTRQPTILSECKTSIQAHTKINSELGDLYTTKQLIGNYGTDILFNAFDESTQKFSVYIFSNVGFSTPKSMVENRKLGIYYLLCDLQEMNVVNNAYCGPTSYQNFIIDKTLFDKDNLANYSIDATWYTTQFADINDTTNIVLH